MANPDNYVKGDVSAPQHYELRINGKRIETSPEPVSLYWKARQAVDGKPGIIADVETVSGFYCHAFFTDATLNDWERASA